MLYQRRIEFTPFFRITRFKSFFSFFNIFIIVGKMFIKRFAKINTYERTEIIEQDKFLVRFVPFKSGKRRGVELRIVFNPIVFHVTVSMY